MTQVKSDGVYRISDDIVVREIEGELIIVPLVRGIGDLEEDIFTLNDEGREIWRLIDGKTSIGQLIQKLIYIYPNQEAEVGQDVVGFMDELLKRKMLVEVAPNR